MLFSERNQKDYKYAVHAAVTEAWSNGQTECQITKLKLVKRRMYGRAKIGLLQTCSACSRSCSNSSPTADIKDRSFIRLWLRRSHGSRSISSKTQIEPRDLRFCLGTGSSNAPSHGWVDAGFLPRTRKTSPKTRLPSSASPQSV